MECVMPTAYEGALLEELAAVPLTPKDRTRLIDSEEIFTVMSFVK